MFDFITFCLQNTLKYLFGVFLGFLFVVVFLVFFLSLFLKCNFLFFLLGIYFFKDIKKRPSEETPLRLLLLPLSPHIYLVWLLGLRNLEGV